jgi:hypothetical protein
MAKTKTKAKAAKVAKATMIGIPELEKEFGMDGRKIRATIRSLGFSAPQVDRTEGTFGPKAKYQFAEGSKELVKIREALRKAKELADGREAEKAKKPKKAKKAKAKAEPDEEEEEEEEEEEDDSDDDSDDDGDDDTDDDGDDDTEDEDEDEDD